MPASPKILVAPLDWGLGHATRCIPIITCLVQQGCEVVLAADGPQAKLLQEAFPFLPMLPLKGYGIRYSRKNVLLKILSQLPKVQKAMQKEHEWLAQQVAEHRFDAVISDNRYGLWSAGCHSVIITHQLQPAMPRGMQWASSWVRKMLYNKVQCFPECWVPDMPDATTSLSGALGHPSFLPEMPVHYIGWLTRFEKPKSSTAVFHYKLLILLSGPEPQRTILENKLLLQIAAISEPFLLVRGLPGETRLPALPDHVTVVNHLASNELQLAMQQSEYILARGGYSTLMDAFTLRKKCLLIPTPGQTEQTYLAAELSKRKAVLSFRQSTFQLSEALGAAMQFSFNIPVASPTDMLPSFIAGWLKRFQQ